MMCLLRWLRDRMVILFVSVPVMFVCAIVLLASIPLFVLFGKVEYTGDEE